MRFIVQEQPYEKPIAAGLFRFERDGTPTGALEHWRLTSAVDGYQVLRVDLDARSAASGHSYLYHLVRQVDGTPERLGYRFWRSGFQLEGTVLFDKAGAHNRRVVNGRSSEQTVASDPNRFWFPSVIGLGLAANLKSGKTVTMNNHAMNDGVLQLEQTELTNETGDGGMKTLNRQTYDTRIHRLSWQDQRRTLTLDIATAWPLKMTRGDGLTAVETHYIWYGTTLSEN